MQINKLKAQKQKTRQVGKEEVRTGKGKKWKGRLWHHCGGENVNNGKDISQQYLIGVMSRYTGDAFHKSF